jgi:anti-sigma factor RsiW
VTETHDPYREWDAAYVLGALNPDERRAFERHLGDCQRCTDAVAELAGMPGILSLLSAADARAAAGDGGDPLRAGVHQATTVQRLATVVRAERRRTRRLVAVGAVLAAGILVTAGIALGGTVLAPRLEEAAPAPSSSVPADAFAMTPLASGTLTADLTVTSRTWGTLLAWECRYEDTPWAADPTGSPVEPTQYALYVTQADGTETAVATWRAAGERAGGLVAATSIPTEDIRTVEIRTMSGNPLARATL